MTSELEQKFFKVFRIKPIPIKSYGYWLIKGSITENDKGEKVVYPEITDRRLLEIITSLANALCNYFVPCVDYYNLKSRLLYDCIQNKENEELQYNIQQLFKERKMTNKINGIDVSEYFIEVVDEGGGTINYKILPNFERLLVERIFKQNQQLKHLQEENEKLKADLKGETEQCQKWYQLETDKHFQMVKCEQALEEIRNEIGDLKNINRLINLQKILDIINEALND